MHIVSYIYDICLGLGSILSIITWKKVNETNVKTLIINCLEAVCSHWSQWPQERALYGELMPQSALCQSRLSKVA